MKRFIRQIDLESIQQLLSHGTKSKNHYATYKSHYDTLLKNLSPNKSKTIASIFFFLNHTNKSLIMQKFYMSLLIHE